MEKELNINCDQYLPGKIDNLLIQCIYSDSYLSEEIKIARYIYIKKLDKKYNFKKFADKVRKRYYKYLIYTNYNRVYIPKFRRFLRDKLIDDICSYINFLYLNDIGEGIKKEIDEDGISLYIYLNRRERKEEE